MRNLNNNNYVYFLPKAQRLRILIHEADKKIYIKRNEIRDGTADQLLLRRQICMLEELIAIPASAQEYQEYQEYQEQPQNAIEGLILKFIKLGSHLPEAVSSFSLFSSFQPTCDVLSLDTLPLSLRDYPHQLLEAIKNYSFGDIIHMFRDSQAKCMFSVLHCQVHGKDSPLWKQMADRVVKFGSFIIAVFCSMGPIRMTELLSIDFENPTDPSCSASSASSANVLPVPPGEKPMPLRPDLQHCLFLSIKTIVTTYYFLNHTYPLSHVCLNPGWYKNLSEFLPFDAEIAVQTQTAMSIINGLDPCSPERISKQHLMEGIQSVCIIVSSSCYR